MEYYDGREKPRKKLGTFKTLDEGGDAMHAMAGLLADFIIEEGAYVKDNFDDFNWEGVNVKGLDADGNKCHWGLVCSTMEAALEEKDKLLELYPQVLIRDNATQEERMFSREEPEKEQSVKR